MCSFESICFLSTHEILPQIASGNCFRSFFPVIKLFQNLDCLTLRLSDSRILPIGRSDFQTLWLSDFPKFWVYCDHCWFLSWNIHDFSLILGCSPGLQLIFLHSCSQSHKFRKLRRRSVMKSFGLHWCIMVNCSTIWHKLSEKPPKTILLIPGILEWRSVIQKIIAIQQAIWLRPRKTHWIDFVIKCFQYHQQL